MTLEATIPTRHNFSGNDSATEFSYSLKIGAKTHITLVHTNTSGVEDALGVLTVDTDYTVNGVGDAGGGSVDFPIGGSVYSTLATGEKLSIIYSFPIEQTLDLPDVGRVFNKSVEDQLDYSTVLHNQNKEKLDRSIKLTRGSTITDIIYPEGEDADNRSGRVAEWNSAGTQLQLGTLISPSITNSAWRFFADASETDHGLTGSGQTVKAHVDNITGGGGDAIVFVPGTYVFSTNESIPADVKLIIQEGAFLSIGSGVTLTIDNPEQIIADDRQIVFTGAATTPITFTNPGRITPIWFGAVADGSSSDQAALDEMLLSAAANSTIFFPPTSNFYKATALLDVTKGLKINGVGQASDIRQTTANNVLFSVTGAIDNVGFCGLKMTGVQFTTYSSAERAINVVGTSAAAPATNIEVHDCHFDTWAGEAIHLEYVTAFSITHNRIDDIHHGGLIGVSAIQGVVDSNIIDNIPGVVGSKTVADYGIVFSRNPSDSLVTEPRSADIVISNNMVSNVADWEGIDVHSGQNVTIVGNTVKNCDAGIVVTGTNNGSAVLTFASLNIAVVGNTIESGVTDGSSNIGIQQAGAENGTTVVEYGTGSIVGNTVIGHGNETSINSGAISIQGTLGMAITGNSLLDGGAAGVHVRRLNNAFTVSGNTVVDPWSDTAAAAGVQINNIKNWGHISGNSFRTDDKSATFVLDTAIVIANNTNKVTVGANESNAAEYIDDVGQQSLRGLPNVTSNTSGTGEDTLRTTTLYADSCGIGSYLKIIAAGTIDEVAGGNKTLKFYLGASQYSVIAAGNHADNDWRFEALIEFSAASSQKITWACWNGTDITQGYDTAAEDMTGDVVTKMTGEATNASDTVYQTMWYMERY